MFIDSYSEKIQSYKNLPLLWCNDFSFGVAIDEPSSQGHNNLMKIKWTDEIVDNYIGHKFNCLTIAKRLPRNKGTIHVEARCECGSIKAYPFYKIIRGKLKSCGCYWKGKVGFRKKHGLNNHPLSRIHEAIKRRCTVSCASGYHRYGGRGIKMCDEWINNLSAFYDWAISHGYRKGLSIDRINNNGNYEPSNCRWVDNKTQARNRRDNRIIEYNGLKKSLAEWAEYYDINYWCLRSRLRRFWSMDKAITTPINKKRSA